MTTSLDIDAAVKAAAEISAKIAELQEYLKNLDLEDSHFRVRILVNYALGSLRDIDGNVAIRLECALETAVAAENRLAEFRSGD
jgi:hypothetical protein